MQDTESNVDRKHLNIYLYEVMYRVFYSNLGVQLIISQYVAQLVISTTTFSEVLALPIPDFFS